MIEFITHVQILNQRSLFPGIPVELKTWTGEGVLWVISYICADMNKLIQHGTVIYFALIILIRMMAMPISMAEYALNKNFIAANLCENRNNTEIHCAGSCFLGKQLARSNDNENTKDHKGSVNWRFSSY
jgi:hypothetical protein